MDDPQPGELRERNRRFTEWERTLRYGGPDQRRIALSDPPPEPRRLVLAAIARSLEDEDLLVPRRAVAALERFGPDAVPALCTALGSKHRKVRTAAAMALADLGDHRALEPLRKAMLRCHQSGSPRAQLIIGSLAVFFVGVGVCSCADLHTRLLGVVSISIALQIYTARGAHGKELRAITAALAEIAERDTADTQSAIAPLRTAGRDLILHDRETRRACREAAARIEAVSERRRSLPHPSGPEPTPTADLPMPADGGVASVDDLPRVGA